MKLHKAQIDEAEVDRLALLEELIADSEDKELAEFRPGSHGCHELIDRSSLFARILEEELLDHPSCVMNAEWYALAHKAVDALHDLYQMAADEHLQAAHPPAAQSKSPTRKKQRKAQ